MLRTFIISFLVLLTTACTTKGQLEYITVEGEHKTACETEYVGAPSVDRYAVEYFLSMCAISAIKNGHEVKDKRLLTLDLSIPDSPNGHPWTFEYATSLYKQGKLSDKEYGYIVAYVDFQLIRHKNKKDR